MSKAPLQAIAELKDLPSYVEIASFTKLSGQPNVNTRISYEYRDGSNYKKQGEIITQGEITAAQVQLLEASLLRDEGDDDFLPRQVGMAYLCPLVDDSEYDDDLDHPVHTITGVALTEAPAEAQETTDLINRFAQAHADGWDMAKFGND